ncbi:YbjN domain-containing protein [Cognatishimia sp. F0-27]|uniref:YbjN domain-containing protein n=1 Tax=Cognatishimia sp. F0-27 TaxID=2816855 RepID=UPI001D0C207A|nr:YbjN domain-containing protein [Cognatishimia sp. F0-27]MCC1494678.1 YbjN domain-containing protein [Cognatishimia sp. F0-27]
MMHFRPRLSLLALSVLTCAHAATAQQIDGTNAERILTLLQTVDPALEIGTDNVGDPLITGTLDGASYSIFFYGCSGGRYCTQIQYQAGMDIESGLSLEKANAWNRDMRYASTFLDDEMDPFLQMDVLLDHGVSEATLLETYTTWRASLEEFLGFIDW